MAREGLGFTLGFTFGGCWIQLDTVFVAYVSKKSDFSMQLTFGGMPYSGKPVSGGRRNFKGCMESINYNGENITDLARRKKLDTSSFVSRFPFQSTPQIISD